MGSSKWTDRRFGQRVKAEREDRGWSQADMAKALSANGIHPMHPTTVAKIEAGDRSVRINEAVGIADLFQTSLDALLDLKWRPQDSDVTYALRLTRAAVRQASHQLRATASTFREQLEGLNDIPAEIDEDDDQRHIRGESELAHYHMEALNSLLDEIARRCDALLERRQEMTASEADRRDEKKFMRLDEAFAAQRPPTFKELKEQIEAQFPVKK